MRALELPRPQPVEDRPLAAVDRRVPNAGKGDLLLRVVCCGVCRTDLHIVEGELPPHRTPLIPGHQVVGIVETLGPGVAGWAVGELAGVPWLHSACGVCAFCSRGEENLCPNARFTGYDVDGGYAEYCLARADFAFHLPPSLPPEQIAPLLCAGSIGFRSLRRADTAAGDRVGLIGFGASAHICLQVARYWGCHLAVFSRGASHRRLALDLGAEWAGSIDEDPPWPLDRAVLFAPVGALVPAILRKLRPGGTLAINAIHLSPIPSIDYDLLYGERTLRSVANLTRADGTELLDLAVRIPLRVHSEIYPLADANRALADMKHSRLEAAAVLQV